MGVRVRHSPLLPTRPVSHSRFARLAQAKLCSPPPAPQLSRSLALFLKPLLSLPLSALLTALRTIAAAAVLASSASLLLLCRQELLGSIRHLRRSAPLIPAPKGLRSPPSQPLSASSTAVNMPVIKVHARMIYDSRGNPTVEVDLTTDKGIFRAAVPSGASTGKPYLSASVHVMDGKSQNVRIFLALGQWTFSRSNRGRPTAAEGQLRSNPIARMLLCLQRKNARIWG